jgi:hypothetical protein
VIHAHGKPFIYSLHRLGYVLPSVRAIEAPVGDSDLWELDGAKKLDPTSSHLLAPNGMVSAYNHDGHPVKASSTPQRSYPPLRPCIFCKFRGCRATLILSSHLLADHGHANEGHAALRTPSATSTSRLDGVVHSPSGGGLNQLYAALRAARWGDLFIFAAFSFRPMQLSTYV